MSFKEKAETEKRIAGICDSDQMGGEADGLEEALGEFRLSIHAWSEAALNRPRLVIETGRRNWRLATGWALGCALAIGGVSGGWFEHRQHQEMARAAAARSAEQQRLAALERSRHEEEDLLAKVDSDISREVPSAMEPLAQLMAGDETQ